MERLRQLLIRINAQLSMLTVSQRIAIGLCAALIAVSMLSLMQWSHKPEMVPLVNYEFSFDELAAVEESLHTNNIPFKIVGNSRILVRPADRHNALRVANENGSLPEGTLYDMESVVTNSNPFQAPEARKHAWTYAMGNELAKIIATSPDVKQASVLLNPTTKRRLGSASDVPTASVVVTLVRGKDMNPRTVEAFAKLVAGAIAGLKPYNVTITDSTTLRSYNLPDPEDAISFDLLGMIKEREAHFKNKILETLADIPGVRVAVTVDLDMKKTFTENRKHDIPQVKTEKSNTSDQSTVNRSTEPGLQANLGTALSSGQAGQSSNSEETSTENFEPLLIQKETIEQLPFAARKVTAAISIPRSFIVGVYLAQQPAGTEEPKDDDPEYTTVRDTQLERVRKSVGLIVMAQEPDDVEVDIYPDMEWSSDGGFQSRSAISGVASAMPTVTTSVKEFTNDYGSQLGLGMLALLSLFMMMRIVRKSSDMVNPQHRSPKDDVSREEEILEVGPSTYGQAGISESVLTGKEVDTQTLRYQELGMEVSKMVENDPDGTADLVRRWMEEPN